MSAYVIGDLQGCYTSFARLLDTLGFDETKDKLWLCGDIVARGENSLDTLRLVKYLSDKGACQMVLGNHDITLIAVWRGAIQRKDKDKTADIFKAKDCDTLLNWLRCQPLLALPDDKTVMVHAGIPPIWSLQQAMAYACELQQVLSGDLAGLDELLPKLYDKSKTEWSEATGVVRLKLITDYFTRMRLCDENGRLEMGFKGGLNDKMPKDHRPWFHWPSKVGRKILFGHWAALLADVADEKVQSLDGGCVWGGKLVAYRLSDEKLTTVCCG